MEVITNLQNLWAEYSPMIIGIGGTIMVVGGTILTLYVKFKPIFTALKEKIDTIFNKTTDEVKDNLASKLQMVDIETRIADLEMKIASPLTTDSARMTYTTQLKVLTEIKTKLDVGVATIDSKTDKYL